MTGRAGWSRRGVMASSLALAGAAACGPRGGEEADLLRVAIDGEPDSLDPIKGQFASAALMYKQLHAPLTEYSPSGGLAPGLAESWRSADARSWTFKLTPGLMWSDGAPITSDDVVWTARRAVDPRTGFADLGDFFAVIGAREALLGQIPPDQIAVSAPDDTTVVFELDRPVSLFPVLMREFYPLPRHAVEARPDDWTRARHWVGAGPYVLAEQGALTWRLEKNPNFAGAAGVRIKSIRVDVIDDAAARARRFRAGDYDLADRPPGDQIGLLRERVGAQLRSFPAPILTYIKVNCASPRLRDARVRRALSLAIDRDHINTHFFHGEARPAALVIPDPEAPSPAPDPDQARDLLAQAGHGPDNRLRVTLRATAGDRDRVALAIIDDWRRAGVDAELLSTYPLDLYAAVDGGDYDLALARYDRGLKTDPDFMLQPFAREGFADNTNWEGGRRPEFDRLMGAARGELDRAARAALHREAEAELLADMPNIPLLHERAWWLVGPRVRARDDIPPHLWRDLRLG
ncbi:peptide ABC transporter substrate-binding protein [Alkalicaulis satelles]|uniref:Peptide ABC transporter substrate-binding protein n=1 Tax=Alkalicaulis satelles TaxID=2609175 RepID=A0A5M6ZHK2_9PROT|nr:peptide ABC transporter substrate-binding protein [Alkalicaulis satelles]KAA5803770.1 peptide ABC transporter substrate-binding protein [Alkalicaulis satelles]